MQTLAVRTQEEVTDLLRRWGLSRHRYTVRTQEEVADILYTKGITRRRYTRQAIDAIERSALRKLFDNPALRDIATQYGLGGTRGDRDRGDPQSSTCDSGHSVRTSTIPVADIQDSRDRHGHAPGPGTWQVAHLGAAGDGPAAQVGPERQDDHDTHGSPGRDLAHQGAHAGSGHSDLHTAAVVGTEGNTDSSEGRLVIGGST